MDSPTLLDRAEAFLWRNARLLERQRFRLLFQSGSRRAALDALLAYRNEDGGFGNALEPDIRCPVSQPVPTQMGLHLLDEIGWDTEVARRACDYLQTIATEEGGVPFALPSIAAWPRAPWWNADDNPPASVNPTAGIVGLLWKHDVSHPWLDVAANYCRRAIPQNPLNDTHDAQCILTFLRYAPDRERAEPEFRRVATTLMANGSVAEVNATGYVSRPLDWAPTPDHPFRAFFEDAVIAVNLDALAASQADDGGWTIPWPAPGPGAEMEWRGWVTLEALKTLRAYGRLCE